jgi:hypothetical protein
MRTRAQHLLRFALDVGRKYGHIYGMKTTVEIPDALLSRAKIVAAQQGTTLRAVLVHSLEVALSGGEPVIPHRMPTPREQTRSRILLPKHPWQLPTSPMKRTIGLDPAAILESERNERG